jgi:large subunit ribosomal protein L25
MTDFQIKADERQIIGKKVKKIRQAGQIPAVLYGHDFKNRNIALNLHDFLRVYKEAGTSNLIDLKIGDTESHKVLFREPDRDAIVNRPIHLDIYKVKMTEKLTTEIPLNFVNESPAVLELEGNLIKNFDALEVECLPNDLVSEFEVDLSLLKTFDDTIKIADIKIPTTIEVKADPEEVVALVMPPRSEEEMAELETEVVEDVEAVEVEEKGQEEGEATEGDDTESASDNPPAENQKKE